MDEQLYQGQQGEYAGFFSRLLALLIDALVISVASFLLLLTTQLILDAFGFDCVTDLALACDEVTLPNFIRPFAVALETIAPAVTVGFGPLFGLAYLVFFWALTGQTPGKAQMGLRVVRMDGEMMNWPFAVRRLLGYGISFAALLTGFLWILFDDQRRGFHDRLAGTCVVYSWDARPDERFLASALRALNRRR